MQFQVPQFIEHEPKILGPLTFRQTSIMGGAAFACFLMYIYFGADNLFIFVMASGLIVSIAALMAFVKIKGRGLPRFAANFFNYMISPKLYLWRRKETPVFLKMKQEVEKDIEEEKVSPLKITSKSKLENLGKRIQFANIEENE